MELFADAEKVSKTMSPFYVLYDLRVAYSHLGSKKGHEEKLDFVTERLGLPSESGLLDIYNILIVALGDTFDTFTSIIKEST